MVFDRTWKQLRSSNKAELSQEEHLEAVLEAMADHRAFPMDKQGAHGSVWLVDDILTTGSTALAARQALQEAGHRVAGLICLGRTPAKERRR